MTILLFRLGVVVVLYLFLLEVVRLLWRELGPVPAPGLASRGAANLEIVNPAQARRARREIIALGRAATIGREPSNEVVVDEETVSSQHARLELQSGRWWIEDLGSTNGTWVNDAPVEGRRALRAGDVIRVGRVRLRFSA